MIRYDMHDIVCRYNCNRYNEDEAKKARDAQEVSQSYYELQTFTLT